MGVAVFTDSRETPGKKRPTPPPPPCEYPHRLVAPSHPLSLLAFWRLVVVSVFPFNPLRVNVLAGGSEGSSDRD